MRRVFVHFLGESSARKKTFRDYLTFSINVYQWYIPVESYFIWLCSTAVGSLYEVSPCNCLFFFLLKGLPLPSSTLSDLVIWSLTNSTCCFKNCQGKMEKKVLNIFCVRISGNRYLCAMFSALFTITQLLEFNFKAYNVLDV